MSKIIRAELKCPTAGAVDESSKKTDREDDIRTFEELSADRSFLRILPISALYGEEGEAEYLKRVEKLKEGR